MANRSFEIFTSINNYEINKNVAYGEKNGYLITLYQMRFVKTFIIPLPNITKTQKKQVIDYLKTYKRKFHLSRVYFDNKVLIIKVKENIKTADVERLNGLVENITNYLQSNNISLGQYCIICGKENADKKTLIMNIEYYVHRSCYDKTLTEIDHELEKNKNKDKDKESSNRRNVYTILTTFIGAFFVGFLWLLLSKYGWISSLIMISAAKFALSIYLLFKDKIENNTKLVITVAVLLAFILSSSLIISKNNITYLELFKNENEKLLIHIIVGLITSIVGILMIFFQKNKINRN